MEFTNLISQSFKPLTEFSNAIFNPASKAVNEIGNFGCKIISPFTSAFGEVTSPFFNFANQCADSALGIEHAILFPFIQTKNNINEIESKFKQLKNPLNGMLNNNCQASSFSTPSAMSLDQKTQALAYSIDQRINSIAQSISANSNFPSRIISKDITNLNSFRLV